MQPDPEKCFESWSEELKSRSDRVRKLIGSAHWLSDGHHKEDLVRDFLSRHLPARLRVTRGFICTTESKNNISREIDVMVTDSESELPWFIEGNLVIAPPLAVRAQIHVKTEFNVKELVDVLSSGAHNQKVFDSVVSGRRLWFGALFFARTKAISAIKLQNILKAAIATVTRDVERTSMDFPDCIAIVDGPVFLCDKSAGRCGSGKFTIRAYDTAKASPAVFLSHLYDSMATSGKDSTRRGEWFSMVSRICNGVMFTENFSSGQ